MSATITVSPSLQSISAYVLDNNKNDKIKIKKIYFENKNHTDSPTGILIIYTHRAIFKSLKPKHSN